LEIIPTEVLCSDKECSVWNNGGCGWGLKVLGGTDVRRDNFDRHRKTVTLLLDGIEVDVKQRKKELLERDLW
jgi:hypothetical protein